MAEDEIAVSSAPEEPAASPEAPVVEETAVEGGDDAPASAVDHQRKSEEVEQHGDDKAPQERQEVESHAVEENDGGESEGNLQRVDGAVVDQERQLQEQPTVASPPAERQPPHGSEISRKIEIPTSKVAFVIGKDGRIIRKLKDRNGVKIQLGSHGDADPHSATRFLKLRGTAENVNKVDELIRVLIAEDGAEGSTSHAQADEIRVRSNKFPPERLPMGGEPRERTVRIVGSKDQIESARALINGALNKNTQRGSNESRRQNFRPSGPTTQSKLGPRTALPQTPPRTSRNSGDSSQQAPPRRTSVSVQKKPGSSTLRTGGQRQAPTHGTTSALTQTQSGSSRNCGGSSRQAPPRLTSIWVQKPSSSTLPTGGQRQAPIHESTSALPQTQPGTSHDYGGSSQQAPSRRTSDWDQRSGSSTVGTGGHKQPPPVSSQPLDGSPEFSQQHYGQPPPYEQLAPTPQIYRPPPAAVSSQSWYGRLGHFSSVQYYGQIPPYGHPVPTRQSYIQPSPMGSQPWYSGLESTQQYYGRPPLLTSQPWYGISEYSQQYYVQLLPLYGRPPLLRSQPWYGGLEFSQQHYQPPPPYGQAPAGSSHGPSSNQSNSGSEGGSAD